MLSFFPPSLNFRALASQEAFANELRGKQVEGAPKYTRIKNNSYLVPKERHGAQPDACSCEKVEGGCGEVRVWALTASV
jgi:hypothetical protein